MKIRTPSPRLKGRLWLGLVALGSFALALLLYTALRVTGVWASLSDLQARDGDAPEAGQHSSSANAVATGPVSPTAPTAEPGVLDVQHWDWLEQDLGVLLDRAEQGARKRLGCEAFQREFIDATTEYLKLDSAAKNRFEHATERALAQLSRAREDLQAEQARVKFDLEDDESTRRYQWHWQQFRNEQRRAAQHIVLALDPIPRHQLLREQALKWLLRLDHGIRLAGS